MIVEMLVLISIVLILVGILFNKHHEYQTNVECFENLVKQKEERIEDLEDCIKQYEAKFKELSELKCSTPPDCEEGPWCDGCDFVKYHRVYSPFDVRNVSDIRVCGKGSSCRHFMQSTKGEMNND